LSYSFTRSVSCLVVVITGSAVSGVATRSIGVVTRSINAVTGGIRGIGATSIIRIILVAGETNIEPLFFN
jgi:alkylhydroperoxidase/carboxymuconolactone decarboxylase family protein YurZ